jgi:alkylhydroperoxidase family enzyme
MTRMRAFTSIADHPGGANDGESRALDQFAKLYESSGGDKYKGKIVRTWGLLLHDPILAHRMLELNNYISNEMSWTQKKRARTLVVQMINKRTQCEYSFMAFYTAGVEHGWVTPEEMAALDFYEECEFFDDEDRLVLDFTVATLNGRVSDELYAKVNDFLGDQETLGLTVAIAYWTFWSMIINVFKPEVAVGPFVRKLLESDGEN